MNSTDSPEYLCNPVVPQRADPWVYKHCDGFYYFTGSAPAYDRIEILKAPSLRELSFAEPKTVWRKHETGTMGAHIWAPELHFVSGKWYLYFAAGEVEDPWKIRMWVLENSSPDPTQGNWTEKGEIQTQWDSFALDATTFEHRGQRYLVWAQKDPQIEGNSNLYLSALENPWTLRGPQVRLTKPDLAWECEGFLVNEGPAFLRRAGRVFIAYSASATDYRYCMGLLWADENSDLLDPNSWHKASEPVFESDERNGQWGPGHNSFTTSKDGATDVLVYHARPYKNTFGDPLYDPNRQARMQTFAWSSEGWPIFGTPVADGVHLLQTDDQESA